MAFIYKIEDKVIWQAAMALGQYKGAPIDLADGFIHFSTAQQTRETAAKHFTRREGLILAVIDQEQLGSDLKWEISRGEQLFPHLYGTLDMSRVIATHDMPLDDNGFHMFPDEIE